MRNFKELKIWQKGLEIAIDTYTLTNSFPAIERFGITSQMTRAGVSIPSNIAEGRSRNSDKDYKRFIEISLGSSYELETQLLIARVINFGEDHLCADLLSKLTEEQKMLSSFINSLKV